MSTTKLIPERQRFVFATWLLNGCSVEMTALACGITKSAVRENIRRFKRATYNEMRAHLAGAEKVRRKRR